MGAIVPNMTAPITVAPMATETARVATVVAPGVSSTRTKEATDSTHADATPALASRQTTLQRLPWWISPVASPRMTMAELWKKGNQNTEERGQNERQCCRWWWRRWCVIMSSPDSLKLANEKSNRHRNNNRQVT